MSLDVYIKYKEKKREIPQTPEEACGSTIQLNPVEEEREEWCGNITHNMGRMADAVPVDIEVREGRGYSTSLYMAVWRPEELGEDVCNTNVMAKALSEGICYMIKHKAELLKYNPENGWGDYGSFLRFLMAYKDKCDENPGCRIRVSR